MTSGVQIRVAGPDDIDALVDSSAGLFAEDAGTRDPTMNQRWPADFGHHDFGRAVGDPTRLTLLAWVGADVAGHLSGVLQAPSDIRTMPGAVLRSMFVRPADRGVGIGSALIERFLDWARAEGAQRATVTAFYANDRARALYERHGFTPLEVVQSMLLT